MRTSLLATTLILTVLFAALIPAGLGKVILPPNTFLAKFRVIDRATKLPIFNATIIIARQGTAFHYASGFEYKDRTYEQATDFKIVTYERLVDGQVVFDKISVVQQARTDEDGKAEFSLPGGEYEAWAIAEEYISKGVGCSGSGSWDPETTWFYRLFELVKPEWAWTASRISSTKQISLNDSVVIDSTSITTSPNWPGWTYWSKTSRYKSFTWIVRGHYDFDVDFDDVWLDSEQYSFTYNRHCISWTQLGWPPPPWVRKDSDKSYTFPGTPPSQQFTVSTYIDSYRRYRKQVHQQWFNVQTGLWQTTVWSDIIQRYDLTSASISFRGLTATYP